MVRNSGPKKARREASRKQGTSYSGATAPICRRESCSNPTWDPSGNCHHHRSRQQGQSDRARHISGDPTVRSRLTPATPPKALLDHGEMLDNHAEGGVALVTTRDGVQTLVIYTGEDDSDRDISSETDTSFEDPSVYESRYTLTGMVVLRSGDSPDDVYVESNEIPGHVNGAPIMIGNLEEHDRHWVQDNHPENESGYRSYDVARKFYGTLRENPELVESIPKVMIRRDSRYGGDLSTRLSSGEEVPTYLPHNRREH